MELDSKNSLINVDSEKRIKLGILKCDLRRCLLSFERCLNYVSSESRTTIYQQFRKLRNEFWQAVDTLHRNMSDAPIMDENEVLVLSDSDTPSPPPITSKQRKSATSSISTTVNDENNNNIASPLNEARGKNLSTPHARVYVSPTSHSAPPVSPSAPQTSIYVQSTSHSVLLASLCVSPTSHSAPHASTYVPPTGQSAPHANIYVPPMGQSAPHASIYVPFTSHSVPPVTLSAPSACLYVPPTSHSALLASLRVPPWSHSALLTSLRVPPWSHSALLASLRAPPTSHSAPLTSLYVPPTSNSAPPASGSAPHTPQQRCLLNTEADISRKVLKPAKKRKPAVKHKKTGISNIGKRNGEATITGVTAAEPDGVSRECQTDRSPDRAVNNLFRSEQTTDQMLLDLFSSDRESDMVENERLTPERASDDSLQVELISNEPTPSEHLPSGEPTLKPNQTINRAAHTEADVSLETESNWCSEFVEGESSNVTERGMDERVPVRIRFKRLRPEKRRRRLLSAPLPASLPADQAGETCAVQERAADDQNLMYFSISDHSSADSLSGEEPDNNEAARLRAAAELEQEPLARVILYLESVLCDVLTGRVLELELETQKAFTVYLETNKSIKLIHSMIEICSAHSVSSYTFSKIHILSLRVQALVNLRMFKMHNREVTEYKQILRENLQQPTGAESESSLMQTPPPSDSLGSVGSSGFASWGQCCPAHSPPIPWLPANAQHALQQLNNYYQFLYDAHNLWSQADALCRLTYNQELFIAVNRNCGTLTLFSTFRHLVKYVRYAISLLRSQR